MIFNVCSQSLMNDGPSEIGQLLSGDVTGLTMRTGCTATTRRWPTARTDWPGACPAVHRAVPPLKTVRFVLRSISLNRREPSVWLSRLRTYGVLCPDRCGDGENAVSFCTATTCRLVVTMQHGQDLLKANKTVCYSDRDQSFLSYIFWQVQSKISVVEQNGHNSIYNLMSNYMQDWWCACFVVTTTVKCLHCYFCSYRYSDIGYLRNIHAINRRRYVPL